MLVALCVVALAAALRPAATHDRPVIGVLAQETTPDLDALFPEYNYSSYITASYVKFVEAAGARAAPVFIRQPAAYYERMFRRLNGLVLPGGDSGLGSNGFGAAARAFWDLAHAHPDNYFPIWGTCQGHEELAFLAGGAGVIAACNASNQAVTVQWDVDEVAQSRLFGNASRQTLDLFSAEPNVIMFHYNCVMPDSFARDAAEFRVLGSSRDRRDVSYVSVLEHRSLPMYGVQFHPEKAAFEWSLLPRVDQIPHSAHAVLAEQYLANFLAAEARRSNNRFADTREEQEALIYNYPPFHTAARGSSFEQCYFF
ncbi:gamma-glutamyl hydrolase-like [Pollicipes pollicipes]|uniref:gamma-glutamyl hydrolase-like n=1 Tax=Pollicipes pollicipes TaxID=41117 RepID=UPI001884E327|nr:gamma-glutamyl hydrolase-like [Pollicipes pollicipes]